MLLTMPPRMCEDVDYPPHPLPTTDHYNPVRHSHSYSTTLAVIVCLKAEFSTKRIIAPMRTDPFELNPTSQTPFQRPPRTFSGNGVTSPELRTFRHANAALQAELKYGSARWDDEVLGSKMTPSSSASQTSPVSTHFDNDENVFGIAMSQNGQFEAAPNGRAYLSPRRQKFGEGEFAQQLESLGLTRADNNPRNPRSLPCSPAFPQSTSTKAVNIINSERTRSPENDPRMLFGSEDTHLPWIKQLSPTQFTQHVSPQMLPRGSPPAKSIWEAEDDEFDRWPTVGQAREELEVVRRNATLKRNTFVRPAEPKLSVAEQVAEAMKTPLGENGRTVDEREQLILELGDMDCGNPWAQDAHDDIFVPFCSRAYTALPASAPARHMHVLDANSYVSSTDDVVKNARPRLCDAVATILAYTSLKCLEAFLDPEVEVFEWRRLGNCVVIRRQGNEVLVGNYYNFGTTYQWGYLVRSTIDKNGAWSETYASVSQGTTPVTKDRVLFEEFKGEDTHWDVKPDNEEFALYSGRELARFLLRWSVWDYNKWWRYKIEWEVDGKVTNARDHHRYPAGLLE
ncbi:uncharacterized protein EKO05_0005164 [Ascochyta rabiei]|uniref:Uncharacterized protein n=1 Tax=Didymella rabiei TaxID=5454 RepID=A0A163M3M6_DIDRA|nr:uncharacterized protein EKO05_0005164 [Ascochyta rabiei]KZM28370.1 hypothetical protein ST47_g506 [Ascochyta rabiei]UPX14689.1 hypothetical protein EKO05_0005164 [Ascochyta rabiei]